MLRCVVQFRSLSGLQRMSTSDVAGKSRAFCRRQRKLMSEKRPQASFSNGLGCGLYRLLDRFAAQQRNHSRCIEHHDHRIARIGNLDGLFDQRG